MSKEKEGMLVLVLVGSTSFDALVGAAVEEEVLQLLAEAGVVEVVLQVGRGAPPHHLNPALSHMQGDEQSGKCMAATRPPLVVAWFRYASSLSPLLSRAALVVGHGGAGTILECARAGVALLCVTNDRLLHGHQGELAQRMEEEGRLTRCMPDTLAEALAAHFGFRGGRRAALPLVPPDSRMFAAFLEDCVGMR